MGRLRPRLSGAFGTPQYDWCDWAKLVTFSVGLLLAIPIGAFQILEGIAAGGKERTDALLLVAVMVFVIILVVLSYMKLWEDRRSRRPEPSARPPAGEDAPYRPS